jgi:long-chain-fatty-acid--CoA ligase ACSBG
VAKAFIALGLEPHASVAIFGFNSPEWIIAEIGAIFAGGVAAGIYPSDTPDQVQFKSRHSGAAIAVVEGAAKAKLYISKKPELPELKAVVVYGEQWENDESVRTEVVAMAKAAGVTLLAWSDLSAYADGVKDEVLDKRISAQVPTSRHRYVC